MKAHEFKELIRKLVIEEVKREVSQQLPRLLFEMLSQNGKTVVRENKLPAKQQVVRQRDPADDPEPGLIPRQSPQPKVIKRYVKDPRLNAVLNETTPGLPVTPYSSGVPIEVPDFEKVGVSKEFMGEMKELMNESAGSNPPLQEVIEETPVSAPNLSKLFNKNFKAILEKSKGKTGGSFSGMLQNW